MTLGDGNRVRTLTRPVAVFAIVAAVSLVAVACSEVAGKEAEPDPTPWSPRSVDGDYVFREDWCPELDFEALAADLDGFDVDSSDVNGDYAEDRPEPSSAQGIDDRLSSVCTVGNSKLPLEVDVVWSTQVYESNEDAETAFNDRERWPESLVIPANTNGDEVDGWDQSLRYVESSDSDGNEKSAAWFIGQDDNLIVMVEAKNCFRDQGAGDYQPCGEAELGDFAVALAEQSEQALAK